MNEVAWQPGDAALLAGRIASQAGEVKSLASKARGGRVGSNAFGLMIYPNCRTLPGHHGNCNLSSRGRLL